MSQQDSQHQRWLVLNNAMGVVVTVLLIFVFGGVSLLVATQADSLGWTLSFVLATITLFELVRPLLRQMRSFDPSRVTSAIPGRSPWVTIGRTKFYLGLLSWPLAVVLMLGLVGLVWYALAPRLRETGLSLPVTFYLALGIYVVYFVARPALVRLARPIARYLASVAPSYTLEGDTIVLDTKMPRALPGSQRGRFGFAKDPGIVRIRMDELDEIRLFTWSEYQAFVQHEIGPDFELMARQAEDVYKFTKGEIDRPTVYSMVSSPFPIALLRGPELLYVVSLSKGAPELLEAFQRFKRRDS